MFYFVAISVHSRHEQWCYDLDTVYELAVQAMMADDLPYEMFYLVDHQVVELPPSWERLTAIIVQRHRKKMVRTMSEKGRPVEGVHCRRGSYRYFRHPRTMRARRLIRGLTHIDRWPVRGKQTHLPSSWDDIGRSDGRCRSWKAYRRTQYKTT